MAIRAKFNCTGVHVWGGVNDEGKSFTSQEDVRLDAVTSEGAAENAVWSQWTPCGGINISITNPAAFGSFVKGKSYYVDFTEAA